MRTSSLRCFLASISLVLVGSVCFVDAARAAAPPGDEVEVPQGPFNMGCSRGDSGCDQDEGPAGGARVDVPRFAIDREEVSVAHFRECVAAGACKAPRLDFCTYNLPGADRLPVNCVTWQDAFDYCAFRGKRLPFEAEWEKAARGGSETPYPWGTAATCGEAVMNDGHTTGSVKDALDGCGDDRPSPVGSRKPNSLGLPDMHGNLVEWTWNWYSPDAISSVYASGDLSGPPSGQKHVARGGSWDDTAGSLRSSNRDPRTPKTFGGSLGFRCARTP